MNKKTKYRIYLSPPNQSGKEMEYLSQVLKSNWLAPGGDFVEAFEKEIALSTGRSHCVALNSGTAALHLALKALGVSHGDYVLCQAFSFVATANPIAYLGATPVFIDSESKTWNMNPAVLEDAIKELKKKNIHPKAIVYAHIYGMPADVSSLVRISNTYDIPLVEDAAEALGATVAGKQVGSFGALSVLSFNGNKVITTAGGGALLTDDARMAEKVSALAAQARSADKAYLHTDIGFNYRMSNLNAAVGMGQLKMLPAWISAKREIFKNYCQINNFMTDVDWSEEPPGVLSSRWLSTFIFSEKALRDTLIAALHREGIEARRLWMPLPDMNIYPNQISFDTGVGRHLFDCGLCLPSGTGLTHVQQNEIIELISQLEWP